MSGVGEHHIFYTITHLSIWWILHLCLSIKLHTYHLVEVSRCVLLFYIASLVQQLLHGSLFQQLFPKLVVLWDTPNCCHECKQPSAMVFKVYQVTQAHPD